MTFPSLVSWPGTHTESDMRFFLRSRKFFLNQEVAGYPVTSVPLLYQWSLLYLVGSQLGKIAMTFPHLLALQKPSDREEISKSVPT